MAAPIILILLTGIKGINVRDDLLHVPVVYVILSSTSSLHVIIYVYFLS